MSPEKSALRALAAGAIVLVAACSDSSQPTQPTDDGAPIDFAAQDPGDPQAEFAAAIPGFGGYFLDETGTPTMYLTDVGKRAAAQRVMAAVGRVPGADAARLQIRQGDYTYAELAGWFRKGAGAALEVPGAVWVDLDEASNRITVGVERGRGGGPVKAALARLGVPEAAVKIQETEPIQFAATLQDRVDPKQGGLQIHFGNYLCTLGFNATAGGTLSFITNSHCTRKQGGTEGTQYYQPLSSVSNTVIATEAADPAYQKNIAGCPKGKSCRRSDASRAAYASGVSVQLGRIAKTTGPNNGSLTIDGFFTINGEQANGGVVGQTVNKVGRTTGWTRGNITNTCVTTTVQGSKFALICQHFVSAGVGSGDSGSPVFSASTSGGNATLHGILWGGNSSGTQFVFSPMQNIEQELGALTTF